MARQFLPFLNLGVRHWTVAAAGFTFFVILWHPAAAAHVILANAAEDGVADQNVIAPEANISINTSPTEQNPVATQSPHGQTIGGREDRPVTIGLRQNLGYDLNKVAEIIGQNPYVRIGWPSEFEISRSQEYRDQMVLIDMANPPQTSGYPGEDMSYNWYINDSSKIAQSPIAIGQLTDGSLGAKFDGEMNKIIRARALESISTDSAFARAYSVCVEQSERPCPETDASDTESFRDGDQVHFGIRNDSLDPQFVYLLMVDPKNNMQLLLKADGDGTSGPLAPGALLENGRKLVKLQIGNYRLFTIRSATPINTRLFEQQTSGLFGPENCVTDLERVLCNVLSGTDISAVRINQHIDADWRITSQTFYVQSDQRVVVGGGDVAPAGFAGWQAQIFSTQTYSKKQIDKDKELLAAGKMLWQQRPYQRYHRCAGSLIAQNVVLTAAHCVAKPPVDGDKVLSARGVRIGTQNLASNDGAQYKIISVVFHAGYTPGAQKDDIALVRIAPISKTIAQKTISLPGDVAGFPATRGGNLMQILGWGYTEVVGRGERHEMTHEGPQFAEDKLRIADIEVLAPAECRKRNGYANIVNKKICGVTPANRTARGNTFSCRGDSGGPVIRKLGAKIVQVGLVSGGVGCGADEGGKQNPSLFVDLAQYSKWINAAKRRILAISNKVEPLPE